MIASKEMKGVRIMYKVISPEWNTTIEEGFDSFKSAYNWARANCGATSAWGGIWEIEYYNPSPFIMST
jgi:hypothetical protein